MDVDKPPGNGEIDPRLLKETRQEILEALAIISQSAQMCWVIRGRDKLNY